jgi:hypothetical protein
MEATGEVSPVEKPVGKDGIARRKSSGASPRFDAACERAKRLGREVEQLKSGVYQLTSPDGGPPVCYRSLKHLQAALDDIEAENSKTPTAAETASAVETANTEASAEAQAEPTVEPDEVEDPAVVLANVLDTIENQKSVAEAYRKIFKVSSFDRSAKEEISDAIESLIRKWRSVQSTIPTPADDKPPYPGSAPKPETDEKPTDEAPELAGTVSALEEQSALKPVCLAIRRRR